MTEAKRFNWLGWLAFAGLLLAWEFAARGNPKLQLYFPPISTIMASLCQLVVGGRIGGHFWVTVIRFFAGYALAALIAVLLGIVLGYFRVLHSFVAMLIEFLRPMPSVAIIPVAILLLGIGDGMIVAVTVYASIWAILINTIEGVRHIEPTLIDTARTFGLGRGQVLWQIILPAASPYIVTGLRIGLSIALILVTTAEMIAGSKGLGFFILDEERSMNSSNMYAGIVVVAVLGYALNRVFLIIESKAMRWHHGMTARGGA
ncbi:MAG: ABC transporter permease [Deltaproteobacteria bacterium]|nr:ABC transporter permease [Deltaproteobacteria bacterium]MBM4299657.1 ABC transporter permease [Deltaproteobacteria bacterium]